jgi:uncharacterized protein RhaS with RHS repeats
LYYYRARYYDSSVGRFISEDPSGFVGGANAYLYTANAPTGSVDPYGLDWIEYTGQQLTVYGGNYGDRSQLLEWCKATSGYRDANYNFQFARDQGLDLGPLPEGLYKINLQLDPTRFASLDATAGQLYAAYGVQRIRDRYRLPAGGWAYPEGWGTWRARLEKVRVNTNRHNFYLHNSAKGYTHGCVETCSDLYNRLVGYHDQGIGSILVNVQYSTTTTNGGTKQ